MGILPGLMGLGEYRSTGRVWGTRRVGNTEEIG
ncbi:hypothetical protein PSTT_00904 [Puccinia striiformis]|nr:hypothetical protein PSTT_00904 [Puccinia striiformis]